LIADPGDALAGTISAALQEKGVWVTLRAQTRFALTAAVRQEHPDFLILNTMYPTMDFLSFAEEVLSQTDLCIIALFRTHNLFLEGLLRLQSVHCWRLPRTSEQIIAAICEKFLRDYAYEEPADAVATPKRCPQAPVEEDIINLLHVYGISPNQTGFTYLRYAILTAVRYPEQPQRIYPDCAAAFHSKYASVEHCIRHSIRTAWQDMQQDPDSAAAYSWFQLPLRMDRKPANLEFITAAASLIRKSVLERGDNPDEIEATVPDSSGGQ
jgi:CheY-like chemotaxis protein